MAHPHRGAVCATLILMATAACVSPGEHLKLRTANRDLQRQIDDLGDGARAQHHGCFVDFHAPCLALDEPRPAKSK